MHHTCVSTPEPSCPAVQAAPEASAAEAPAEAGAEDARDAALEEAKQLLAQVQPLSCRPLPRLATPSTPEPQASTCIALSRSDQTPSAHALVYFRDSCTVSPKLACSGQQGRTISHVMLLLSQGAS